MKTTLFINLLVTIIYSSSVLASVDELFLRSLKNSKQVEIFNLTQEKTLSDLKSTTSTVYPSLGILNTNRYGNNTVNSKNNKNDIDTQVAVSLEQKLFQGGAEFALYDYQKVIPKKAQAQREKSLSEYYGQFSVLYFQVSSAMEEKEKVEALFQNLKKRVVIVKQRAKIGRDRKADLYALESQLHRLEADLFTTAAQLKSAKTEFFNFSGLTNVDGIEDKVNPLELKLLEKVNFENRPEYKNLKLDYDSSLLDVKIEKAAYYPQVDLGANYFLDKGNLGKNDWDVSLNIKLNLLDFGKRSSSVQSKRVTSTINKARLEFDRLNASRKWENFVNNFNSKKRELASLKEALEKSKSSYNEQLKDLKRGLITQIEVIRSLDDVISLEKLSIRSSLEVKSLYYQANAYLGHFPKS